MVNAKLIHEYLDGEIDSGTEDMLFTQLRSDSEMRKELNTQMKIVSLAQRDKTMNIPPLALTNSLFNKLGYDIPVAGNIGKQELGFFKRNMIWLLLLLLSITTVSTVYFANRNSFLNNEIARFGKFKNSKSIPVISSVESDKNSNVSENTNDAQNNNTAFDKINNSIINSGNNVKNSTFGKKYNNSKYSNIRNKYSIDNSNNKLLAEDGNEKENNGNLDNSIENSKNQNVIISKSDLVNNSGYKNINALRNKNEFNNSISSFNNNNGFIADLSQLLTIDKTKWSIQIKNMSSFVSSPDISINSNSTVYNNIAIGLCYQVNTFHSFGLEIGSENFSQEFTTNKNLVYQQKPELIWIGASYRYSAKEWIVPYFIYPYFQQFVGATTIGPLFKTQTGLVFNVLGPISIVTGAEYGILFYNVDAKIYNTNKINLFGGVSINF